MLIDLGYNVFFFLINQLIKLMKHNDIEIAKYEVVSIRIDFIIE